MNAQDPPNDNVLPSSSKNDNKSAPPNNPSAFFNRTKVTDAEIYWLFYCLEHRLPLNASKDIIILLAKMFPEDDIAKKMTMSASKAAYSINFGLSPYFQKTLDESLKESNFYTLCFDESLNKVTQNEQMDISFRFVDRKSKRTVYRYYTSVFLDFTGA